MSYDLIVHTKAKENNSLQQYYSDGNHEILEDNAIGIYRFIRAIISRFPESSQGMSEKFWTADIFFNRHCVELCCISSKAHLLKEAIVEEAHANSLCVYNPQEDLTLFPPARLEEGKDESESESEKVEAEAFFSENDEWVSFLDAYANLMERGESIIPKVEEMCLAGSAPAKRCLAALLTSEAERETKTDEKTRLLRKAWSFGKEVANKRYCRSLLKEIEDSARKFGISLEDGN